MGCVASSRRRLLIRVLPLCPLPPKNILSLLRRGGFCITFQAIWTRRGEKSRTIALKLLHAKFPRGHKFEQQLVEEACLMKRLDHR
jgi:hypothetical protein